MAYVWTAGEFVYIRQDSSRNRQSRGAAIARARTRHERDNGVRLTLIDKTYDEMHGFLSRSQFRYTSAPADVPAAD